ncbi:beta-propeller domain-containing protein [Micromonospora sp. FIMYZ51]|uniref:beta-propeller domain-containing protein n=1 Tax=Micromonospora sp. FIMYZ51 TaxID=3051832 RepID=UPI00311DBFFD
MFRGIRTCLAGTLVTALIVLAGCTDSPDERKDHGRPVPGPPLVGYDSCDQALAGLRTAAAAYIGPDGFLDEDDEYSADYLRSYLSADGPAPTGTEPESGGELPDVVKTDGRRIVLIDQGFLRVVDTTSRQETGKLKLHGDGDANSVRYELLLRGDRALVVTHWLLLGDLPPDANAPRPKDRHNTRLPPGAIARMLLIDLSKTPRILSKYQIQGYPEAARLTGDTVRVMIRTNAKFDFPADDGKASTQTLLEQKRQVIAEAGIDSWLPKYEWYDGSEWHTGQVGCDRFSGSERATGAWTLTVLSFDLTRDRFDDGDPVSIAARPDLVHVADSHLYVAEASLKQDRKTDIYQFDIAGPGRPRYLASGSVPGWPESPDALSGWQGQLRVITGNADENQSPAWTLRVLRGVDGTIVETGVVGVIGQEEQLQSVRYLDDQAYLITRRYLEDEERLYTLDLKDPGSPRVAGDAKLAGRTTYLHPLPDGRLLGVGHEMSAADFHIGPRISLFDMRDPSAPTTAVPWTLDQKSRVNTFRSGSFQYEPGTGLLTVTTDDELHLLRLTDGNVDTIGVVEHPEDSRRHRERHNVIDRSMLADGALWTVSRVGIAAHDPTTAKRIAWLPLPRT